MDEMEKISAKFRGRVGVDCWCGCADRQVGWWGVGRCTPGELPEAWAAWTGPKRPLWGPVVRA